jgi:hypothetical protein
MSRRLQIKIEETPLSQKSKTFVQILISMTITLVCLEACIRRALILTLRPSLSWWSYVYRAIKIVIGHQR